ncbi:MAG: zinc ribbon domain-containing protein [Abitibacteriaceae bacterium]|nr:zinc ribbon domain-containing protein [Abditibacteriaceae bacterium]MBV9866957.1 zinc ribbon domain-containing protein [Abditibacteriaceae bacterium]
MALPNRLTTTCPQCGATNASTMLTCVKCGAPLKEIDDTDTLAAPMPPSPVSSAAANADIAPASPTLTNPEPPEESHLNQEWIDRVNSQLNRPAEEKVKTAKVVALSTQVLFYIGCALLIILPLSLIGFGTVRAMLHNIFQH